MNTLSEEKVTGSYSEIGDRQRNVVWTCADLEVYVICIRSMSTLARTWSHDVDGSRGCQIQRYKHSGVNRSERGPSVD